MLSFSLLVLKKEQTILSEVKRFRLLNGQRHVQDQVRITF